MPTFKCLFFLNLALIFSASTLASPISLTIDASDYMHRVYHVTEKVPVTPGAFTMWLPKWEPGTHSPSVPVNAFAGLIATGNKKRIEFKRDTLDAYAFKFEIPEGVSELELHYDWISQSANRVVMTPTMINLQWIQTVLYPANHNANEVQVTPSLILPEGWKAFCALSMEHQKGAVTQFKTVDLETLFDSPLFAGKYYKTFDLDPNAKIPVRLNVVADDPRFLNMKDEQLAAHRSLVQQAYKLYNSQHYDHYDFLLALSKQLSGIGLEHHRSSENAVDTPYFLEWDPKSNGSSLLPHEYTHSWNGKFRRPADLSTPHYNVPMQDSLLWVYEGMTNYWGEVLAARSGIRNMEGALNDLALTAAMYSENRPGLSWRSLQDTTNDPIMGAMISGATRPYMSWQMRVDYYPGAALMWLEADVTIRKLTKGSKSLNDFASSFLGVDNGAWGTKTYTFDDVVKGLNDIVAYDWNKFLRSHLDGHGSLLGGIEGSGWRLVYKDTPNATQKAQMGAAKVTDFTYTLGFTVDGDGKFTQVRWDGPAFRAGLGTGMTLLAVNDRAYNKEYLEDAIKDAQTRKASIKLTVKDFDMFRTVNVEYHGGLRYPYLERIENTTDYLTPILSPMK